MNHKKAVIYIIYLISALSILQGCGSPMLKAAAMQEGLASYYGKEFDGRKTSSGEIFHKDDLTAAHRTYPFGTILRVTNLKSGDHVEVRINDRGPVKPERIIDLSYGAAKVIGLDKMGLVRVRLEVLDWGK
jgi:rare lipoprotein A